MQIKDATDMVAIKVWDRAFVEEIASPNAKDWVKKRNLISDSEKTAEGEEEAARKNSFDKKATRRARKYIKVGRKKKLIRSKKHTKDEHMEKAKMMMKVIYFESKDGAKQSNFPSLAAASSWHARVKRWEENLRRDLRSDGFPAPGNKDERWMLLSSSSLTSDEINDTVICMICKKCCRSLSRVEEGFYACAHVWIRDDPFQLRLAP